MEDWYSPYRAAAPGKMITAQPPDCYMEDEDVEALEIEYPDHSSETSFVISGPLGVVGRGPGRRFSTMLQASAWVRAKYGRARRIREAEVGDRWAFRVPRPNQRKLDGAEGEL